MGVLSINTHIPPHTVIVTRIPTPQIAEPMRLIDTKTDGVVDTIRRTALRPDMPAFVPTNALDLIGRGLDILA